MREVRYYREMAARARRFGRTQTVREIAELLDRSRVITTSSPTISKPAPSRSGIPK